MVNILFATNRQQVATSNGIADFGDQVLPQSPAGLICASATVANIDIDSPSSGTITNVTALNQGTFADADLAPILQSGNNVLIFIHGCANSFQDAITRAAYNQTWLANANLAGGSSAFDIIAFSWPARSYFFANIPGDYGDYRADQTAAEASSYHFGLFLDEIYKLQQQIGPKRRISLLCHSMGNYVLGFGVDARFSQSEVPGTPFFDQVVLAAADETATTFSAINSGRLVNLFKLGEEITVYYNNDDIAMALSHIVNQDYRLGYEGPPNEGDTGFFPPTVYQFVDCTGINDYISTILEQPDRSHQYYRQSPTVRADIVRTIAGFTPLRPKYDPTANFYSLFPSS